jgi:hypothetical protein
MVPTICGDQRSYSVSRQKVYLWRELLEWRVAFIMLVTKGECQNTLPP